ncbi:muramidase, partial [Mesorhizobium sp. M7A.F.Ca.CA.004.05.1.1]
MRIPGVVSFLIASLCLAGCSSTAGVDALDLQKPSNETTSSVIRPPAPIAAAPAARGNRAARAG